MKLRTFIAGHRGMLGHVVCRYLSQIGYDVVTSETRYNGDPKDKLVEEIRESGCNWVVNAIGRISQKPASRQDMMMANFQFPVHLKSRLKASQYMVHASTDCVFSGEKGNYASSDERDATSFYGLSKMLGECVAESSKCYVIRSSIIGPELKGCSGLMSWFMSQAVEVYGFENHIWNGITSLQWAKICVEIINERIHTSYPLLQAGTRLHVNKHDLLKAIKSIWSFPASIARQNTQDAVDRSLVSDIDVPDIWTQLCELKGWYYDSV